MIRLQGVVGGMKLNEELNNLLINVQLLLNTGAITKKLEGIKEGYKRNIESETRFKTGFGHTFSRMSLTRFEEAINRRTKDEEEDFRKYLNRLMYEKNITQATISRRSLIKGATLSRYINGSRNIPTEMIFRIAFALKLNLIETET